MGSVAFTGRALADLERIFDFIAEQDPAIAGRVAELIMDATVILQRHPMIGRPVRGLVRELVISHGRTGYVALYRVLAQGRRVEVLAIRHQREAGFG